MREEGEVREPVAVVGIGCRLPGAHGPRQLWDLLETGTDAVGEIPADRFDVDRYHDPEPGPGRISTRLGGFLADVDLFDAGFFGISGHEAARIDPQHRLMAQTVWEAVEDAGLTAEGLAGSATGVYTACLNADYWDVVRAAGLSDMHAVAGNGAWGMPAGRLSHLLDLRGPSLGVEATCSTSLLAVHLACRDLWSGHAEAAIVAGVNLLLAPDFYFPLSEAGILSRDGRRRFGDAGSDGYVRSEGAVAVVLKPLGAALRDGDRVYATILGGAVNNNGRGSDTLITPSVDGQAAMLRAAHADAGVSAAEVDYVEAHGAGTPVGDEVELTALGRVFGSVPRERPCLVGSVKSNIGHIEAAAGLAGLAKTALALHRGVLPATLRVLDPHPVLAGSALELVTGARPWPATGRPAVAGVSSFGLSATNVHLVLRAAPAPWPRERERPRREAHLVPVSARDEAAARALAAAYADVVERAGDEGLVDVAFTAATRRSHHAHRIAVSGADAAEVAAGLRAAARAPAVPARPPRVVFVYSGQGSQWKGMGRDLYEVEPAFRREFTACAEAIRAEAGWWLPDRLDSLAGPAELQPALWAFQVALAATWREWGLEPEVVIGHSMGEIAAACTAGVLTLRDGAAIACRRGELIARLPGRGAMAALGIGEEEALRAVGDHADEVAVAVVNGPDSVVLAGEPTALEQVVAPLREAGVFCRYVDVEYASHSPHIDPIRAELAGALADVEPRHALVPMRSTVTGERVRGPELDGGYWVRNLREQVRFGPAVAAVLAGGGPVTFVEISPHPVLGPVLADRAREAGVDGVAITSAVREEPVLGTVLAGLGEAYARGHEVRWDAVQPPGSFTDLPLYPWQGRRHWVPTRPAAAVPTDDVRTFDPRRRAPEAGRLVAVCLEVALTAVTRVTGGGAELTGLHHHGTATPGSPLRVVLHADGGGWRFTVRSEEAGEDGLSTWTTVLSGHGAACALTGRGTPDGDAVPLVDALAEPALGSVALAAPLPDRVWKRADGDVVRLLAADGAVVGELRGVPGEVAPERPAALDEWFVEQVRALLGADHVDRTRRLPDLGMDSVLAAKLIARVRAETGVRLPTRALLGGNTVDAVIAQLTASG
ncbi:type I polyketide synthase [Saccharothrix syringae]|uniref:Type I polyketide synthase n=1 Tax=Saccharothrix syringae TaxID=103733 RepID=A0A5Q0H431_SACSY|nr:type I polyketide synthase [Saccharothrix syringae]QFZ20971.1 type I polyketide synthase [Saccharothrix syringae]